MYVYNDVRSGISRVRYDRDRNSGGNGRTLICVCAREASRWLYCIIIIIIIIIVIVQATRLELEKERERKREKTTLIGFTKQRGGGFSGTVALCILEWDKSSAVVVTRLNPKDVVKNISSFFFHFFVIRLGIDSGRRATGKSSRSIPLTDTALS